MDAKPLDLVLFRGNGISRAIVLVEKMVSDSDTPIFSHVGIVVSRDVLPIDDLEEGILYVLESTLELHNSHDPKDVRGRRRTGVQLRKLEDIIQWYKGVVAIAKLIVVPESKGVLLSVWKEYKNGIYSGDIVSLLSAAFPCLRGVSKITYRIYTETGMILHISDFDNPYVMCSELVCIIYQRLGLIPKNIDPKNIIPMDLINARGLFPIFVGEPVYIL